MKCFRFLSIAMVVFGLAVNASAQTVQEVGDAYNKAGELLSSGNLDGVIAEMEKCIELAKQVGAEADEMRKRAEVNLPGYYLEKAKKVVAARDYPAALTALDATIAVAEKYNNTDVKEDAEKNIPQIYYAVGATAFQAKKYDEAIKALDEAVARDPNLARAYFIRGASYQSLKNEAGMAESYKLAIEKGEASGDATSAKNAKAQLFNYYYAPGAQAKNAQKWDTAIPLLNKAIEVDNTNPTAYYALASCYNAKKNFDNAIASGEKAAELMGSGAKIADAVYYELGLAYVGKKDNGKACENFKKVAAEPYLKGAKHYIDVTLKCK